MELFCVPSVGGLFTKYGLSFFSPSWTNDTQGVLESLSFSPSLVAVEKLFLLLVL